MIAALPLCAAAYLLLVRRCRRRNPVRGWNPWRTAAFLTGLSLLAAALLPPIEPLAEADFRGHMLQHLLIGMYAPLAIVLGAPLTLLLRTLPATGARRLTTAARHRFLRPLTHPATALSLSAGGLGLLYFTPLYALITAQPLAHHLLHAHFLVSGCLFAYAIAGPDPAPARPSVRARLIYLGAAIAVHACLAQLMYARFGLAVHAPTGQIQGAAQIMYYGGDIAELLLAAALVTTWRPVPARTRAAS